MRAGPHKAPPRESPAPSGAVARSTPVPPLRLRKRCGSRRHDRIKTRRVARALSGHCVESGGLPFLCHSLRKTSSSQGGKSKPVTQALKKPRLPQGRFDAPEDSHLEKEPLKKFPDDVNPVTKEKGGPRGPEPTRYGDWERKGRCIDF
ncbi:succinate dehydrogenase assembly factor 4, mitochondrial [Oryctolagus cuniculus]|uniref:succinate dehydrogenase assembly factor 4, mitochondrial n=1 Tax=Oryctolagus cuniculus TaxID=9986 RepID=UPI003879CEDC